MNSSSLRRFSPTLLVVALAGLLAGCTDSLRDQITFSDRSREEGIKLLADKDYIQAAGCFSNAVKQEPRDFRSHYYLGVCRDEMKQGQLAMESFKTALAVIGPLDDEQFRMRIIDSLGHSIALNDDRDVELNAAEARAKANPRADHLLVLAKAYRYRRDPDLSMKFYNQAIMYDGKNFAIYKDYGLYLLDELKQSATAEVPLRRAYAIKSDDDQVNNALRRLNVVPGPSLKDQGDLAKPLIPRGPLPDLTRVLRPGDDAAKTTPTGGVKAPRD